MADKRITDLPLISSGEITSNDVLPIVNINLDETNKIELGQLQSFILSGVSDNFVTGGTYSGGTLVLDRQNGSITITGFTTGGTSLYEVGSGIDSTQRVGVGADASGDYSTVSGGYQNTSGNYYTFNGGGSNNITLGEFSSIVGGLNNQNILGLVNNVSFNSGDASIIPDNTYSVYPTNISGYGSGLQITFDVNTGVVSNVNVVSPGIRYEQGEVVLVSGNTIGGLSPANDLTFNLDSVIESHYSFIGGGNSNTASGNGSTILNGCENKSIGNFSTVLGGTTNTTLDSFSTISGGYCNTTSSGPGNNFIGNGRFNTISSYYGCNVIGGGDNNKIYDTNRPAESNFIGGGSENTSSGYFSTVAGGIENCSFGNCSFIGGGRDNIAYCRSVVTGGRRNTAGTSGSAYSVNINGTYDGTGVSQGTYSVYTNTIPPSVGFGLRLLITFDSFGVITNTEIEQDGNLYNSGDQVIVPGLLFAGGSSPLNDVTYDIAGTFARSYASIIGGCGNKAYGEYSTISGGQNNTAYGGYSVLGGGLGNTASCLYSTISGGLGNTANGNYSFVGGGGANRSNCTSSTISGGYENTTFNNHATISGGFNNTAGGECSFIGGGWKNISGVNNFVNAVSTVTYTGGTFNSTFTGVAPTSTASGSGSGASFNFDFVSGILTSVTIQFPGSNYVNGDTLFFNGSIFGGTPGVDDVYIIITTTSNTFNAITGGQNNKSFASWSTISGGYNNQTKGFYSFVGGGLSNTSNCVLSTIGGGLCNINNGNFSFIGGGSGNIINNQFGGVVGGCSNVVNHDCSFIIGNGISSTADNTTHINCLNLKDIPVDPGPGTLPLGTVYMCSTGNILHICI